MASPTGVWDLYIGKTKLELSVGDTDPKGNFFGGISPGQPKDGVIIVGEYDAATSRLLFRTYAQNPEGPQGSPYELFVGSIIGPDGTVMTGYYHSLGLEQILDVIHHRIESQSWVAVFNATLSRV